VRIQPSTVARAQHAPPAQLTAQQKSRAEGLTSLFENGTPVLQYAYAEQLHDGRGVTAGRAGFTTGTDDAAMVVEKYTAQVKDNPLAKYLPRLKQLSALPEDSKERASVKGLEGFEKAWAAAAKDPKFNAAQDAVVDQLYYRPSQKHADQLGLKTPLARAQLYDAIIQHGDGSDPDGLPALIQRTNKAVGGSPAQGVDEKKWAAAFLAERRKDLSHAYDASTRKEWAGSVDRVGVYEDLVKAGNWDLKGPIKADHGDFKGTMP
jgi:chitosanase